MKRIIAFITAALMAVSMAVPAMAAEEPSKELINPKQKGSITVTMETSNGTLVPGGELSLYQVATVEPGDEHGNVYQFQYTSDFKELYQPGEEYIPNDTNLKDLEKKIAQYQESHNGINPVAKADIGTEDDDLKGVAVFKDLTAGIYLIRQTKAASGYYAISPFLMTVPVLNQDGTLEYNPNTANFEAKTYPKVEPVSPTPYNPNPGPNPTPSPTPGTDDLTGNKVIEGAAREKESAFTFELAPLKADSPMPEGSQNGKKTVTITGPGTIDFGKIEFKAVGDYTYTVREIAGTNKDYQYDRNVYYVVYHVEKGTDNAFKVTKKIYTDEKLTQEVTGARLTITNKYEKNGTADPSVQKVVKVVSGQAPATATTFSFTLTPAKKDNPMPAGTKDGKMTISINGAGTKEFGTITFTKAGTYEYTVQEVTPDKTGRYSYDKTLYKVVYTVDEKLDVTKVIMDGQKKISDGDKITVTNQYRGPISVTPGKTVTPSKTSSGTMASSTSVRPVQKASVLPQTGQLWWPVWVLMAAGGVCVITEMLRRKKN